MDNSVIDIDKLLFEAYDELKKLNIIVYSYKDLFTYIKKNNYKPDILNKNSFIFKIVNNIINKIGNTIDNIFSKYQLKHDQYTINEKIFEIYNVLRETYAELWKIYKIFSAIEEKVNVEDLMPDLRLHELKSLLLKIIHKIVDFYHNYISLDDTLKKNFNIPSLQSISLATSANSDSSKLVNSMVRNGYEIQKLLDYYNDNIKEYEKNNIENVSGNIYDDEHYKKLIEKLIEKINDLTHPKKEENFVENIRSLKTRSTVFDFVPKGGKKNISRKRNIINIIKPNVSVLHY